LLLPTIGTPAKVYTAKHLRATPTLKSKSPVQTDSSSKKRKQQQQNAPSKRQKTSPTTMAPTTREAAATATTTTTTQRTTAKETRVNTASRKHASKSDATTRSTTTANAKRKSSTDTKHIVVSWIESDSDSELSEIDDRTDDDDDNEHTDNESSQGPKHRVKQQQQHKRQQEQQHEHEKLSAMRRYWDDVDNYEFDIVVEESDDEQQDVRKGFFNKLLEQRIDDDGSESPLKLSPSVSFEDATRSQSPTRSNSSVSTITPSSSFRTNSIDELSRANSLPLSRTTSRQDEERLASKYPDLYREYQGYVQGRSVE
jgi:hypothetical protein